ncbi:hypothetical protein [Aquamicrobium terrae]|uniref:Uncharacterized protein n=1 Tax=Aquamicrobium terrae TaxID=1324945 RepID=A0ABV2MYK5_9HYPH
MNMGIALTLDGLVRALRWKAHELAERIELRRPASPRNPGRQETEEARDDRGLR